MEFEKTIAIEDGKEALANARKTLANALEELDRYIVRFDNYDDLNDKAAVLNWAINHLATYIPSNVRLDLIAIAQARLTSAAKP